MYDRRDFLKTAMAASIIAVAGTPRSFASSTAEYTNIIYTKDNIGRWVGKEKAHLPQVTVTGSKVAVVTKHPMSAAHFIVRHTLVLEDGTYVGSTTFTPTDKPESTFELPAGYTGTIFATSFCNMHDFWLAKATV